MNPESRTQPLGRLLRVSIEYSCSEEPGKRVREVIELDLAGCSVTSVTVARVEPAETVARSATSPHSAR